MNMENILNVFQMLSQSWISWINSTQSNCTINYECTNTRCICVCMYTGLFSWQWSMIEYEWPHKPSFSTQILLSWKHFINSKCKKGALASHSSAWEQETKLPYIKMLPLYQEEKILITRNKDLGNSSSDLPISFIYFPTILTLFLKLLYCAISGLIATESSFFLWGFPGACKALCVSPVNPTHITLILRPTKNLKKVNLKVTLSLWKYLLFCSFLIL
jgi:hypothetical protein